MWSEEPWAGAVDSAGWGGVAEAKEAVAAAAEATAAEAKAEAGMAAAEKQPSILLVSPTPSIMFRLR
jgi:hypothetical protein